MNLLIKLLNLGSQCEEAGCLCESHPELFVAVTQGGHCGEDGVTVPRLPSELQVSYSCSPHSTSFTPPVLSSHSIPVLHSPPLSRWVGV